MVRSRVSEAVQVCQDAAGVARAGSERVVKAAALSVAERGRFVLALSGGSTPLPMYRLLATAEWSARVPWDKTHVIWADERCVPPDHPDSNWRSVQEALLSRVPIPEGQAHRMRGEEVPAVAAEEYEQELRELLGEDAAADLVVLGMGADGHTASLFPGTEALAERERWVVANHVPSLRSWRLTLTYPFLNRARQVMFLVTGEEKANTLVKALSQWVTGAGTDIPAAGVHPTEGSVVWVVDEAAARGIL